MKTIGLFYGSSYGMTEKIAQKIKTEFKNFRVDLFNVKTASETSVKKYKYLIFGTSAWGRGEMQDDWVQWVTGLKDMDFSGKKVALFGLGDQVKYPDTFVDGMGKLYDTLPDKSVVVGDWPTEGYQYNASWAERDGRFVGLALDQHNQKELTDIRIKKWVTLLENAFS